MAVALWVLMHINEIVVWGYPDRSLKGECDIKFDPKIPTVHAMRKILIESKRSHIKRARLLGGTTQIDPTLWCQQQLVKGG